MKTNGRRKVKFLTRTQGRKLLDKQARHFLHMSGDEFVRKWQAKEFKESAKTFSIFPADKLNSRVFDKPGGRSS